MLRDAQNKFFIEGAAFLAGKDVIFGSRTPRGVRGLKLLHTLVQCRSFRRTPRGVRGLK